MPHFLPSRRPTELLKEDGTLMQQMQFSERLEFWGVQGSVWEPESHFPPAGYHVNILKTGGSGGEGLLFLAKSGTR